MLPAEMDDNGVEKLAESRRAEVLIKTQFYQASSVMPVGAFLVVA